MATSKSLARTKLQAPPPLVNLKTPVGSNMKPGINSNPWETSGGYSPEQTAAGYGDVPAMTLVTPTIEAPSLAQYGPSQTPYNYPMSQEAIDAGMNAPTAETNWFGDKGVVGGIAQGVQAAAGLANAYLGYKNYGLAKDKFMFEKAATNRSVANQASEYNTGIQNAGEVGMSLAGNTMNTGAQAARQAQLNTQKISTAPIG